MAFSIEQLREWSGTLEQQTAQSVLAWGLERFHPRLVFSNSLQMEDVVVLDMAWRIQPGVRVFTLDTGRLHQETYDLMDRLRERYGITLEVLFPEAAEVETMVRAKGLNLFYESVENRHECCGIRKVKPLQRYLSGQEAWVTGLRREQWGTRSEIRKVELDTANGGILKLNPIADWTWRQVDDYSRAHQLPRHQLYDKGFSSIGCAPCTRATASGENPRAGRWWWEDGSKKECGLHAGKP